MMTPWGESLDADDVLGEYPRPQLVRDSHLNLNGTWQYAFTPATQAEAPQQWDGEILVPFSPEAPLSGVGRTLQPDEALWYRRDVTFAPGFVREAVLLHFGAVDQDAEVWVDGRRVGEHRGGFLPFTLDVTDALANTAVHDLVVRVRDVTDTSYRSRGKQRLKPGGIWYTPQSGIWQPVWMESVPAAYVSRLDLVPSLDSLTLTVHAPNLGTVGGHSGASNPAPSVPKLGTEGGPTATITVSAAGTQIATATATPGHPVTIPIPDPRLWTPEDPFLYDLTVTLGTDRVTSYAALRTVGVGPDAQGRTRLLLNGEPYLHAGLLDQGYWPDGLLTAPSDEAYVHDIAEAKRLGFTMLRKHIKVEPLRWYHHCDRLGMLVWQDMVNGGRTYNPAVITAPVLTPLKLDDRNHARFGRADAEGREEFLAEVDATVELLRSVPSVVAWVPFNEGWGQFDSIAVTDRVRALDPTRVIDSVSGWHDQGAGDMVSRHVYFVPYALSKADADEDRAAVLSEYGGYSHRVSGHTWTDKEFGYRRIKDRGAFERAYLRLQQGQVRPAIARGLAGFVYTQIADVEQETNGLMTYDRKKLKVDAEAVAASNAGLRSEFDEAVGHRASPVAVVERELTEPVALTRSDGKLNPDAVGWCRTPLVDTDGIRRAKTGPLTNVLGRNKRWEYWAVTTPDVVVAVVLSDIDYAGVNALWVWDRRTGQAFNQDAITPFGAGVTMPGTLGAGTAELRAKKMRIEISEVDGGTRIRAIGERVRVDVVAHRPEGHESLGVVVPWTERLFQYTVKDVARPATGAVWFDGKKTDIGGPDAFATLDHGRGRWPRRMHWNWGAGSGRTNGRTIGIQVGGKWTDGTGSTENSILVDGRLHKISEELVWTYDTERWLEPWRITGTTVDLTFTPEYDKVSATDLKAISSFTHQCFGVWSGTVTLGDGEVVRLDDVFGWAEDVHQKW